MSSSSSKKVDGPLNAPCPFCNDDLDREEDEKFGKDCYMCGKELPYWFGLTKCPDCGIKRKTGRGGNYALLCHKCKFNYNTGGRHNEAGNTVETKQTGTGNPHSVKPSTIGAAQHSSKGDAYGASEPPAVYGTTKNEPNRSINPVQETHAHQDATTSQNKQESHFGPEGKPAGELAQSNYPDHQTAKRKDESTKEEWVQHSSMRKDEKSSVTQQSYAFVAAKPKAGTTTGNNSSVDRGEAQKRSKTTTATEEVNDVGGENQGLYEKFKGWQNHLKLLKDVKQSDVFDKNEVQQVGLALENAEILISSFDSALGREKQLPSGKKKQKTERSSSDLAGEMRKLMKTWSSESNAIYSARSKYFLRKSAVNEPMRTTRYSQATHRQIEFWVVLPSSVSDKKIKLNIEVRSNHSSFVFSDGLPLAMLKETSDGIWKGISFATKRELECLEYKYRISDSAGNSQWELLYQDCNRYMRFCNGEDCVIYDGAILLKAGMMEVVYRLFFSHDEIVDRCGGYIPMLPKFKEEIQEGKTVMDLAKWVEIATSRMMETYVGFRPEPKDDEIRKVKRELHKRLVAYVKDQCKELSGMINDERWLNQIIASMIALLRMAFETFPSIETPRDLVADVAKLVIVTANKVGSIFAGLRADEAHVSQRLIEHLLEMRHYSSSVVGAIHTFTKNRNDSWIHLIPFYHLLITASDNRGRNYDQEVWWGTQGFDADIQKSKELNLADGWMTWLEILKPYFRVDAVLPYTFLAMLSYKQLLNFLSYAKENSTQMLDGISLDGIVACVRHYLNRWKGHSEKKNLYDQLHGWLKRNQGACWCPNGFAEASELSRELLVWFHDIPDVGSSLNAKEYWRDALTAVEIQLLLAARSQYPPDLLIEHLNHSIGVLSKLRPLMSHKYLSKATTTRTIKLSTVESLKLWQDQFQCKSECAEVDRCWSQCCQEAFSAWLRVADSPSIFAEHLLDDRTTYAPEMNSAITEFLFSMPDWWSKPENQKYLQSQQLLANITPVLEKSLRDWQTEGKEAILVATKLLENKDKFFTLWMLQDALQRQPEVEQLSAGSAKALAQAASIFERVMNMVIEKTITLAEFQTIQHFSSQALDLSTIVNSLQNRQNDLKLAFKTCTQGLKSYNLFTSNFSVLWQICQFSIVDAAVIDAWLHRSHAELKFVDTVDSMTSSVICELIPAAIRDLLERFCSYRKHKLFQDIISETIKGKSNWKQVESAIRHSMEHYDEVVNTIITGSINVSRLKDLQRAHFGDSKDELLKYLTMIITDGKRCDERRDQINICVELEHYCNGADALLKMRDMFGLTGDFSNIEKLSKAEEQTLLLKNISQDLLRRAEVIKSITLDQMKCLKAFADSADFVKWVRSEVQRNEITVFVDLASSVLGEDDLATHQSHYLLNALTGYTPLIYDFDADKSDLTTFLDLCKRVWQNMDSNPQLPENLIWSSSQIENFKRVKDQCGSTVMAAVSQAAAINSTGVYEIGNIRGYSKDFKTLDDVIRLTCNVTEKQGPAGDQVESEKSYTYTELKDLQSRLALVAGDKQKEGADVINLFDEMRDAVENLASAYMEIRKEGCIQFDDMMVVVHCKPGCAVPIEIKLQSIGESQTGLLEEKTALKHCQTVYAYLTTCVKTWRERMDSERRENIELNYFTTEQLVALRKELGRFASTGDSRCLNQALPLLAMIHPTSGEQLLPLMAEYKREQMLHSEEAQVPELQTYEDMTTEQQDIADYIQEECDISKETAVEAMNALGSDDARDLERVNEWVDQQRAMQLEAAKAEKDSDSVLANVVSSLSRGSPLRTRLDMLWDEFVEQTNKSIKDFLGVSHLSYILRRLKGLNVTPMEARRLPWWLERGKPILIGIPGSQIYKMALTIYEADPSFEIPTRNEVLVCTKETRRDEVSLFLNRALNDPVSFYCMLNCHLLKYEVCRIIETRLSNLADQTVNNYGLAFIYAEEVKDARIKAYLDKHLVRNCELKDDEKLKEYVQQMLSVSGSLPVTACCVDPDRSFARLIRSSRAGTGKSLKKKNLCRDLRNTHNIRGKDVTICLHKTIETDSIMARLTKELGHDGTTAGEQCHTIHLDIAHEVESGVDELLFNLIILRSLVNSEGVVWQAKQTQYYIIECMPFINEKGASVHQVVDFLPTLECITPQKVYSLHKQNIIGNFIGFDEAILQDEGWQLVLKHLICHEKGDTSYAVENIPRVIKPQQAVKLLIDHCGLPDPTWAELRHYVHFLSSQLRKAFKSSFCTPVFAEDLPNFKAFVVGFMLKMAQDFATRSLRIAEETPGRTIHELAAGGDAESLLADLAMKKTWEKSNFPYLFFNEDGESFSTLGFSTKRGPSGYVLYNKKTGRVFDNYQVIPRPLHEGLVANNLPISKEFDTLSRVDKLTKLRSIMVKHLLASTFDANDDPDPNYVLTMDNAKKIIAIHQRLSVDIPVIIMGETGCGKTKLIEFMSQLQVPTALKRFVKTMEIVKIHGGTTEADIVGKIGKAQKLANANQAVAEEYAKQQDTSQIPTVYTILFLDEVNTTEAIGLIKEIICDNRMNGIPLPSNSRLKIIAACNPYRRHSDAMIEKLKTAGLGYNVGEDETVDRFGKIPMRHLVYRVQALPQSLLPLVWDFGTLQSGETHSQAIHSVEGEYITEMIHKFEKEKEADGIHFDRHQTPVLSELLSKSQTFMRKQKDECSFVSLRDIQRLLVVASWFYKQREYLFPAMDELKLPKPVMQISHNKSSKVAEYIKPNDVVRSILLAVGVCYLARLETATRKAYARCISGTIRQLTGVPSANGAECLVEQITLCQDVLVDEVVDRKQHKNIAKNKALKENVFMMVVCIENRIPLYVIGKPGSSKSLSKSMVLDAMKGDSSRSKLFQHMKSAYMVSFQCSRHATPEGIINVFAQCASYQERQDLEKFVSVVVLDEVGLAEDSENMPLKALHPLLENGCVGNETPAEYKICGFVGISNWALDPAKMNRGIFIQVGSPAHTELEQIARQICGSTSETLPDVDKLIGYLAESFQEICKAKKPEGRDLTEFFGLRDFYSLMKMVVNFARSSGNLTRNQLEHSIKRNFGGFDPDDDKFSSMRIFKRICPVFESLPESEDGEPATDSIGLIQSGLFGTNHETESRYLLILTENLSVLNVIMDEFSKQKNISHPEVVFGSKFGDDVSYTQVCHNVYRIKMCMDMGRPVILLNLDDLYESLYDALNQYFSMWGNKKFVDLGLGTHRVKAYVHDSFRLVLIAEKSKVHSQFPIPLINRLEKHYMSATSLLDKSQKDVKKKLEVWMKQFVSPGKTVIPTKRKEAPELCQGCSGPLDQPYRLLCSHSIGDCCRGKIEAADNKRCPVEGCDVEIDMEEFEWVVDVTALDSRQYFESSSVSTTFIGYSSEMVALVVKRTTNESMAETSDYGQLYKMVFSRAKKHLLQCATAESILRLDRTLLKAEAQDLLDCYVKEQEHENLFQFLEQQLSQTPDVSLLIQITSFAELMNRDDIFNMQLHLNLLDESYEVESIFLKDFPKESLFTDALTTMYAKKTASQGKILIIQCESANDNVELLDSVRYIVQREIVDVEPTNHTVLLLSLARGRPFGGYQGGKWKCVHIDDPRSPQFGLPSLGRCLEMRPHELFSLVLTALTSKEQKISGHIQEVVLGNQDEPPPLAGSDDEDYPDTELIDADGAQNMQTIAIEVKDKKDVQEADVTGVLQFVEHCLPRALSVIKCENASSNVGVLKKLFQNKEFQRVFLHHAHKLLNDQDVASAAREWVKADAAKSSNMKKSETLRHSLEDSLERAFRPAIAAVISFITPQDNLKLLHYGDDQVSALWLAIFSDCDKLGLSFDELTKVAPGKNPTTRLPETYVMRKTGIGAFRGFSSEFPFSWLVKDSIDRLMSIAARNPIAKDSAGAWLAELFKKTPVGKAMNSLDPLAVKTLTLAYINDFVCMVHSCSSQVERLIIEKTLIWHISGKYMGHFTLSLVHLAHDELRNELLNLSTLLRLNLASGKVVVESTELAEEVKLKIDALMETVESDPRHAATAGVSTEHENSVEQAPYEALERSNETVLEIAQAEADIDPSIEEVKFSSPLWQRERVDVIALQALINKLWNVQLRELQSHPEAWIDKVDQCKLFKEKVLHSTGDFANLAETKCRSSWSKLELKKLYVEHVIMACAKDDKQGTRPAQKILTFLSEKVQCAVYHTQVGFDAVVASLKKIVGDGLRGLHKDCPNKCPGCNKPIGSPSKLPVCGHFLCSACVRSMRLCPGKNCEENVPKDYAYTPEGDDTISEAKMNEFEAFRSGLNNFFRHFVSELVFAEGVVPEIGIIEWLSECVTFRDGTKKFSLFTTVDVVDPTPVLRSFLIKLLLQYQEYGAIEEHMNATIECWGECEDPLQQLPKMVMVINCHKDLNGHIVHQNSLEEIEHALLGHAENYPTLAAALQHPSLPTLAKISEIQCLLVRAIEGVVQQQDDHDGVFRALKSFLKVAEELGNHQPGYFVVRQLLAVSGESYVKDLINTPKSFLAPQSVQEALVSFSVPDVLSVFGDKQYKVVKSSIDTIIQQSDSNEGLADAIQCFVKACDQDESLMLHTIFTRITRTFASKVPVSDDLCVHLMKELLPTHPGSEPTKKMLRMLLERDGLPAEMNVNQSKGINLSMLIIHLLTKLSICSLQNDLYPLAEIILQPMQSAEHYIPTMVDNQIEIVINEHQELIATGKLEAGLLNSLEPFSCSCGYRYVIGNCARPINSGDKCPTCGSAIGGIGYDVLAPGNKKLSMEDIKSKTGHILGHPVKRADMIRGERKLDALSFAVLRCLTHLSMFASMLMCPHDLVKIIKPSLGCPEDAAQFLEGHIQIDLQQIADCCAESTDSCILLLHDVINQMKEGTGQGAGNWLLTTIGERQVWEERFCNSYIKPVISEKVERLHRLKSQLSSDTKKDLQTLLSTEIEPINKDNIVASSGLWNYVRPLTLTSLREMLNSTGDHPTLKALVANSDALIAVKCLPDILQLVNMIAEKFHSQFTREQAKNMLIKDVIAEKVSAFSLPKERLEQMVNSYMKAWNIATKSPQYPAGALPLDDNPCVSTFLIDKHVKPKSAPLELFSFIVDAHNNMVSALDQHRDSISLAEVTPSLLVSLSNRDGIFSLVSAHSEYAHGSTTDVLYNWDAAEREAQLKFIGTRRKITYQTADLPAYTFQEDFNLWSQMKILSETQVKLPRKLQEATETTVARSSIQNLTTSLKDLNIAINYLSAIPKYDQESSLSEFMQSTVTASPQHLREEVKVKHVLHLWRILKYAQAGAFMQHQQKPFDDIDTAYTHPLPQRGEGAINDLCTYHSPRTKLLLEYLFAYIILRLNKEAIGEDLVDSKVLMNAALREFIMSQEEDDYEEIIEKLPTLPELFMAEHAASIWSAVWIRYTTHVGVN